MVLGMFFLALNQGRNGVQVVFLVDGCFLEFRLGDLLKLEIAHEMWAALDLGILDLTNLKIIFKSNCR